MRGRDRYSEVWPVSKTPLIRRCKPKAMEMIRRVGTTPRLNPLFLLVLILCAYFVAVSIDATRDLLKAMAESSTASSYTTMTTATAAPPPPFTTTRRTTAAASNETDNTFQRNNGTKVIVDEVNNMTIHQNITDPSTNTLATIAPRDGGTRMEEQPLVKNISNNNKNNNDTNTQSTNDTNKPEPFFSACLLVMDDNYLLREWLAYQYHVLPLRHLVVAVDPRSRTSPTPILDMARQELGLNITEWTDADFDYNVVQLTPNTTTTTIEHEIREQYIIRQRRFIGKCVEHFHKLGHSWTAVYDIDEYPTINRRTQAASFRRITRRNNLRRPGGILRYILEGKKQGLFTESCIVLPRVLFGAVHNETDTEPSKLPRGLDLDDPARLDTLRFRQHAPYMNKLNGLGKPLIDASQVGPFVPLQIRSPHRIVFQLCGSPFPGETVKRSPFRVNHYLGSWEQYSYRDDSRKRGDRSREAWEVRARLAEERDLVTHTWLGGFVQSVGTDRATRILKGTGLPRNYTNRHNDNSWGVGLTAPA